LYWKNGAEKAQAQKMKITKLIVAKFFHFFIPSITFAENSANPFFQLIEYFS
jgi:hypothetical protein